MKKIPLTQGKFALVDDGDFEFLNEFNWKLVSDGYAARNERIAGKIKTIYIHRIVNKTPKGMQTDHINGDRLDCQKPNLRNCTNSQNQMNSPKKLTKRSTSKYKGVCKAWKRELWRVQVNTEKNKTQHIGYYKTEIEAARAYDEAAGRYFGEFAWTNF
jgi:hypothetical protein